LFTPRRRRDEALPKQRKLRLQDRRYKKRMAGYLYPVATESEASRYILGKLLSPKRHHRSK